MTHEADTTTLSTAISICAGIGGLDDGVERALGLRTVAYIERSAYAQSVLMARMEDASMARAPIFFDVTRFDGRPFRGAVDCVFGGIPCQPHSTAGKQLRQADERDLIDEFLRIVCDVEPAIAVVENVRGFLAAEGIGKLLGGLAYLGYDAEWEIVQAQEVGASHKRARVFILAYRFGERLRRGPLARVGREPSASSARMDGLPTWPPGPESSWRQVPKWLHPTIKPVLRGMVDGVHTGVEPPAPFRKERLKVLGNAVVPAQAEAALNALFDRIPQ